MECLLPRVPWDHSEVGVPQPGQGFLQVRFELAEASRLQWTVHKTHCLCSSNIHHIRVERRREIARVALEDRPPKQGAVAENPKDG